MGSLSLDEEEKKRSPLQQIQNKFQHPATSYQQPSRKLEPLSSVTEDSSDSDVSTATSTATETKVVRKRKVLR